MSRSDRWSCVLAGRERRPLHLRPQAGNDLLGFLFRKSRPRLIGPVRVLYICELAVKLPWENETDDPAP
jgi:hypothetical protein